MLQVVVLEAVEAFGYGALKCRLAEVLEYLVENMQEVMRCNISSISHLKESLQRSTDISSLNDLKEFWLPE